MPALLMYFTVRVHVHVLLLLINDYVFIASSDFLTIEENIIHEQVDIAVKDIMRRR